jgi:chromosome segregation ATPase
MVDHENELQAFDSSGDSHDYPKNSVNSIMKANKVDRVVDIPDSVTRNPAMDRVQSALKAQLARTRDRIHRQFQEQQHGFWEAKKEREDCGVELYGMQQQLAQVQNQLDDTGDQHGSLMNNRQGAEEKFIHLRDEVKIRSSKRDKLKKKSSKRQEELDEVDSTLKQAEKFNQETKNEVAVTKTVASKAEEIVKGAEKGKEAQDVYIDGLNQQTKHLETETKWATKQLAIQRNQTEETDKVIKELAIELEVLSSEKKRLVQQWNSAILALGRRDQALGAVTKAMKEANDNSKDHTNEMIGLSRQSFNISLELEKVMFERNKIENELEFLEASIAKTRSDQESFASQQELISKIITNTQEDEAHEERQAKEQLSNATSLGHKIEGVSRERRELEDR